MNTEGFVTSATMESTSVLAHSATSTLDVARAAVWTSAVACFVCGVLVANCIYLHHKKRLAAKTVGMDTLTSSSTALPSTAEALCPEAWQGASPLGMNLSELSGNVAAWQLHRLRQARAKFDYLQHERRHGKDTLEFTFAPDSNSAVAISLTFGEGQTMSFCEVVQRFPLGFVPCASFSLA